MYREFLEDGKGRMDGAIASLDNDLAAFSTGRASLRMLDRVVVTVYGMEMSLKQLALVSVPEPQQLAVKPFDATTIPAIEKAIIQLDTIGSMPMNDGKLIRINIPRLTEDRRRGLCKKINKRVEEAKIAIRNVRRDVLNDIRDLKNEKMITEDDLSRAQDDMKEIIEKFTKQIDEQGKSKTAEVMEI